jgi:hypothetical protein
VLGHGSQTTGPQEEAMQVVVLFGDLVDQRLDLFVQSLFSHLECFRTRQNLFLTGQTLFWDPQFRVLVECCGLAELFRFVELIAIERHGCPSGL